jgi:hypothetical protein
MCALARLRLCVSLSYDVGPQMGCYARSYPKHQNHDSFDSWWAVDDMREGGGYAGQLFVVGGIRAGVANT